jgi:uncharacterized membrane protein
VAVVVRHPDGSFTLDRETFPAASNVLGSSVVDFLAELVVGAPIAGATVGDILEGAGTVAALASAGVAEDFISEVKGLMKPGPSAILVLDDEGDMDVILHAIRGLGGTVLKTNVDLERAQLIQSTLAAPSTQLPVAVTVFPGEIYRAPKSWTQRAYRNLVYFNEVDNGGHFAAWEQPQLFSEELRAAFRSLRGLH